MGRGRGFVSATKGPPRQKFQYIKRGPLSGPGLIATKLCRPLLITSETGDWYSDRFCNTFCRRDQFACWHQSQSIKLPVLRSELKEEWGHSGTKEKRFTRSLSKSHARTHTYAYTRAYRLKGHYRWTIYGIIVLLCCKQYRGKKSNYQI